MTLWTMSRVPDIECSALQALTEGEERSRGRGAVTWLVGLNPGVLEVVRRAGLAERLGRERMLFNASAAIDLATTPSSGIRGRPGGLPPAQLQLVCDPAITGPDWTGKQPSPSDIAVPASQVKPLVT
jgi:hypothetical protein